MSSRPIGWLAGGGAQQAGAGDQAARHHRQDDHVPGAVAGAGAHLPAGPHEEPAHVGGAPLRA
eukprot:8874394-Pyramimonas_sp.AAC.2